MTLLTLLPTTVKADSLERLLMPGSLVESHAKLEDECNKCHRPLGNISQKSLCLDCHEKVQEDIDHHKGFHSQPRVEKRDCKSCHRDHIGRNTDIAPLDQEAFDHGRTDFKLKGSHKTTACASCHLPEKKYREAKHECFACHKNDDVHRGEQGENCQDCHSETDWKKTETLFNHDDTDFKLKGKHNETSCLSCHLTKTYTNAPKKCDGCHLINDVHAGRFGKECQDCHIEKDWKSIQFDHDKETDYPLTGEHKKATCHSCHSTGNFKDELKSSCHSCHLTDDVHSGRNGKKCKDCHTTNSWTDSLFNHDKATDFALSGQHKETECTACHKGELYQEELSTQCISCHRQDDVHKKGEGEQCGNCHNDKAWQERVLFDHDVTHFPLTGLHSTVSCEECHLSADFKKADSECIACHKEKDTHENRLGQKCKTCHTPGGWEFWQFEHDEKTEYRLTGKHNGLECHACHINPVDEEITLSTSCANCHRDDDVHYGRFGRFCERCHETESFENIILKMR